MKDLSQVSLNLAVVGSKSCGKSGISVKCSKLHPI